MKSYVHKIQWVDQDAEKDKPVKSGTAFVKAESITVAITKFMKYIKTSSMLQLELCDIVRVTRMIESKTSIVLMV